MNVTTAQLRNMPDGIPKRGGLASAARGNPSVSVGWATKGGTVKRVRAKRGEGEHAKRKAAIVARTPRVLELLGVTTLPDDVRVKAKADGANKLETAYADQVRLEMLVGRVADYDFQPIHLDLATGVSYCPDVVIRMPDGSIEIVELKGQRRDGGLVRFKLAASKFPQFRFRLVGKRGGEWCELRVYSGRKAAT